jgi:CheY-like chemotaxis protein
VHEQNRKIPANIYRFLISSGQPERITDAVRETVMKLNSGSLCVTDDFAARSRVRPDNCFGRPAHDSAPATGTNERFATHGALAEAGLFPEPASSSVPLLPAGRRDREVMHRTVTILLVDDDEIDVIAIRRSFWQLKIANPLVVARNGLEARSILRGDNGKAKLRTPYLVLLDLDMPRMGGIAFLDELRRDPELRRTLVFVMTSSAAEQDRARAYERNVAGYLMKPASGEGLTRAISALECYWRAIEFPD